MALRKHRITLDEHDLALVVDGLERHIAWLEDLIETDMPENRPGWRDNLAAAIEVHDRLAAL